MRILEGSVARRNIFLVTNTEMAMFYALGARRCVLKAAQTGLRRARRVRERARYRRDSSGLFQRKTFVIVMMGECEARRLCACALESAWPISQYSWENLGKKQTN